MAAEYSTMRTTLDIDDNLLALAKELAAQNRTTAGKVISAWARQALPKPLVIDDLPVRNGFRVLSHCGAVITNELIEELLEPQFDPETGLWDV
jgi:hypothetical protein